MNEVLDIIGLLEQRKNEIAANSQRTLSDSDMRTLAEEIGKALVKILIDSGILSKG